MAIRSKFFILAAVALVLAIAACSDDDPAFVGTTDTTPPGVATVTPVDAFHVDVEFSEPVTKASAEDEGNYLIYIAPTPFKSATANAYGGPDTLEVAAALLRNDDRTVAITTGSSMSGIDLTLAVNGVADTHGNEINEGVHKPFTGSTEPDVTPPQFISRTPTPGALGISIGTPVVIVFNEPVNYGSFIGGVGWTSATGPVPFSVDHDGTQFTLTPNAPLAYYTVQTITLTGVQDLSGNTLIDTEWSFTTTNVIDTTPPTLVSTTPAHLATHVGVNSNVSLTFSEAVNPSELTAALVPDPGDGAVTWSNGSKTVTFDPAAPLLANQQYTLTVYPNGVVDLAGNGIVGLHTVVFTTGNTVAAGSIAGTIAGDPGSEAADPTGATVIAANGSPFNGGAFDILGSVKVAGNDTYSISHLTDGSYYLLAILDTGGDGNLDPFDGDAIGAYGIDVPFSDTSPDSVAIEAGTHETGINFPMFDPSAISGTATYAGGVKGDYPILVGLFDTDGFSPTDTPVAGTDAFGAQREWAFNTLDQPLPDDDYYVGAFMDVNGDGDYNPLMEPAGMYGGLPVPTALHIANGADISGIVIPISDPIPVSSSASISWPAAKHNAVFQRLREVVRQNQLHASR